MNTVVIPLEITEWGSVPTKGQFFGGTNSGIKPPPTDKGSIYIMVAGHTGGCSKNIKTTLYSPSSVTSQQIVV